MPPRKQQSSPGDHTALLAHLADEIRFRRERAGLSRERFGKLASIAPTTVASYESGHRPLNAQFVLRADEILDADGALTREWERLVTDERQDGAYSWFIELEKQATAIRTFETMFVPGLLQTEGYARRVYAGTRPALTEAQIDRKVQQRMERREMFSRTPEVPLWFVLDEAVLRRIPTVDGVAVEQLTRLLELAKLPNVSLGVIAFDEGIHASMNGPLTLLSFADGSQACHLISADGARITTDQRRLAIFRDTYDGVLSAALPQRQSEDLIQEALENL